MGVRVINYLILSHSSEIRGLSLMKYSNEILQMMPYFWNMKTNRFRVFYILGISSFLCRHSIGQGNYLKTIKSVCVFILTNYGKF